MPLQLAKAIHKEKVSRTGAQLGSSPWSRDSLFSVRKTFLPQVFRISGPHRARLIQHKSTNVHQGGLNICYDQFSRPFDTKHFLRGGENTQEEKVYTFRENQINGTPANSERVASFFLYLFHMGKKKAYMVLSTGYIIHLGVQSSKFIILTGEFQNPVSFSNVVLASPCLHEALP